MSLETNMDRVLERRQDIESRLANAADLSSNQLMQLSRELAEIKPVAQQVEIVRKLQQSLQDAKNIAVSETDNELIELALAETEELLSNPIHPYTKRLISSIPIPDPSYKRERYELDFSELDNIIANNSDELPMAEVKSGHFVATHDVKGLL